MTAVAPSGPRETPRCTGRVTEYVRGMAGSMLAVVVAASLTVAACAAPTAPDAPHDGPTASPAAAPPLDGQWRLESGSVDGEMIKIPRGQPISLEVNGATAGGRSSCNAYGASVVLEGSTIEFRRIEGTLMGCLPAAMTAETEYLDALGRVRTVARDGDQLTLTGPGVELRFETSGAGS